MGRIYTRADAKSWDRCFSSWRITPKASELSDLLFQKSRGRAISSDACDVTIFFGAICRSGRNFAIVSDLTMQDARTAYAWAYSLVRTNHPQQANAIADILRTRSLPQDIRLLICKLYTASESYELAIPCLRELIQQNPSMSDVHYELGATLIRLDRPEQAIPELRAELVINPNDMDAKYDLAYALLEGSQKEEAIELLRSILTLNPNYPQAQYQLGKVLLEGGNVNEAIEHLEIAARLDSASDFVHYQLQVAYRRAGRTSDANRELQRYKDLKAGKREGAVLEKRQ